MQRLKILQDWLEKSPNDPFLHFGIAMEYLSSELIAEALEKLEYISEQFPDYLANYYQLAKLYETNNNENKAIATYEKGIEIAQQQGDKKTAGELLSALEELTF
ncbi:MAG: tetratricopeptide repeat protein [bacterium]|nr:tetratricopeptide repeat protein [bacterium]